jgi:hypothetical protein
MNRSNLELVSSPLGALVAGADHTRIVRYWHKADVNHLRRDVRFQRVKRKCRGINRTSAFDPERTWAEKQSK